MAKTIHVMAAKADDKVVLWETDPLHVTDDNPTGEIFVSGDGTSCEVGLTPEVQKRLNDGTLVEVKPGGKSADNTKAAQPNQPAHDDTTLRPAKEGEAPPYAINPVVEESKAANTATAEPVEKPVGGKRK